MTITLQKKARMIFAKRWNKSMLRMFEKETGAETEVIRKYSLSNAEVRRIEYEYSCTCPADKRIVSVGKTPPYWHIGRK